MAPGTSVKWSYTPRYHIDNHPDSRGRIVADGGRPSDGEQQYSPEEQKSKTVATGLIIGTGLMFTWFGLLAEPTFYLFVIIGNALITPVFLLMITQPTFFATDLSDGGVQNTKNKHE